MLVRKRGFVLLSGLDLLLWAFGDGEDAVRFCGMEWGEMLDNSINLKAV